MVGKMTVLAGSLIVLAIGTVGRAAVLAQWTFETSVPATAGPFNPEVGSGQASGSHAGAATYSSPAGNGSSRSFSSNTWAVGDYYQFQTSTTGSEDLLVTFDQTSSSTGPRDFQFQYSTNGTTFTNFGSAYSVLANGTPNPAWSAGTPQTAYSFSFDLSSITALNNAPAVYFRLSNSSTVSANGGTTASTGTDRVDNFTISAVPEPGSMLFVGLCALTLVRARRRA
jgi:hypothetical protein